MVTSALIASGYTTGLYTSPHLHTWRERMRVNGEIISEEDFAALVGKVKPEVEALNQKATYGPLTTFELITALGFAYFKQKTVDFQVMEVGLGGKFDATNIIRPEVCIITSISFDHTDVLGNSLAKIATEKSGIIKPGCTVVTAPQYEEVSKVIDENCQSRGVELVRVGSDVTWESLRSDLSRQLLKVTGRLGSYELSIPLLGDYQLGNAATAVAALEVLAERGFNISRDSIVSGLAQVSWPGRFQILSHNPLLVVDGAHNPDAARRLKQSIKQYLHYDRATLVMGASSDKDIAGIVSELAHFFNKVIVTRSQHPRAMVPVNIAAEFNQRGVEAEVTEGVPAALSLALFKAQSRDLVCVIGSLFVVAEAIEHAEALGLKT